MDIQGEKILAAPRSQVWRALNEPAVLQRCLAGCDTFEAEGENKFRVAMHASVGPVRARFAGKLQLLDLMPEQSYALAFEGSGGAAGFGKGSARVTLDDVAEGTRLRYTAQAQVGGRLSQVGGRLIDGVTRRMADEFFSRLVTDLASSAPAPAEVPVEAALETTAEATVASTRPSVQAPASPEIRSPQLPPAPAAQPPQQSPQAATQIAVIAAAVAATAAAVAVLAAVMAIHLSR
jgi:carbon monoxide dehydrogenase subunit G